jgi:hypothetical protein
LLRNWSSTTSNRRNRGRPTARAAATLLFVAFTVAIAPRAALTQPTSPPAPAPTAAEPMPVAPFDDAGQWHSGAPDSWPDGRAYDSDGMAPPQGWFDDPGMMMQEGSLPPGWTLRPDRVRPGYLPVLDWLGLRHSYSHGRNVGVGWPLTGTSWLNRPYYVGGEIGVLWITRAPDDSVTRDTDFYGGILFGWDWDYYWGAELRFNRATPEFFNHVAPEANRRDGLFQWSYNQMYYPWGDSMIRPYWRWGIGNTHLDFPTDYGQRRDEWMLTFPLGIGVKYPVRRWLAARAELTDQLTVGHNGIPTMNNITLTFGLECRFGAHSRSYWPWNPSRHIW